MFLETFAVYVFRTSNGMELANICCLLDILIFVLFSLRYCFDMSHLGSAHGRHESFVCCVFVLWDRYMVGSRTSSVVDL
jgi:hypothetical protein